MFRSRKCRILSRRLSVQLESPRRATRDSLAASLAASLTTRWLDFSSNRLQTVRLPKL